jgi:citrate lyase subunit beta/citryl-CoA lyase
VSGTSTFTPRRSVLYMPGANTRALEKARTLPADALILDLEDAVAPDAKEQARENVCAAVAAGGYGRRELTIRANGIGTPWHEADLRAVAAAGPSAVVVPKISSADEVHAVERILESAGAPDHLRIWAMLETPQAVHHAVSIATASERLAVLVMGTNDLLKELRCQSVPGRAPLLWSLSACVAAARYAGKTILDGVYNAIDDAEGFAAECRQGAQFGFDGKTLIHPSQLDPANEAFAPSAAEVEHAHRVIAAFDEAVAAGKGVVTLDGRMIENLHVDNARRAIAMDDAIRALAG